MEQLTRWCHLCSIPAHLPAPSEDLLIPLLLQHWLTLLSIGLLTIVVLVVALLLRPLKKYHVMMTETMNWPANHSTTMFRPTIIISTNAQCLAHMQKSTEARLSVDMFWMSGCRFTQLCIAMNVQGTATEKRRVCQNIWRHTLLRVKLILYV